MNNRNIIHMLCSESNSQMNSFIIQTADGKLIVIDGGYTGDAGKLLSKLKEYSGSDKPRVDAWFLSHAHNDHISAFVELADKHADEFECEVLYYCFPSFQFFDKYENYEAHTVAEFYALLPKVAGYTCIVTSGDTYTCGDATFDILYSPEPDFTMNAVNNSSIVIRMTLGGKVVMFLGDLGVEAGNKLLSQYGAKLKSDVCQMAHHGQNGVTRAVYEAISPEECLWCTPLWLWNNDAGLGYNTHCFQTVIVRGWMEELGVKKNYVTKDGDQTIEL